MTSEEHAVKRSQMYIGSTEKTEEQVWLIDNGRFVRRLASFCPGLIKIVDEILVNAADNKQRDERMAEIRVEIEESTGEISVWNDGRGLPIERMEAGGDYIPSAVFGTLYTSSNYDDDERRTVGGCNGLGAKLTNIYSSRFRVRTASAESGLVFEQTWHDGMTRHDEPVISHQAGPAEDYTEVRFTPDYRRFGMGETGLTQDALALIRRRVYDLAATLKGVRISLNGEQITEEFGDVGLMTGDVTINADASCLVMTTEILRSMLYRGSQMMREVGWVVFDEIHYMRDKERGVVWEETIILLPSTVHHVFLSATIPNAKQFAEWVCWLHSQPCHVVYTDYRPTPLQHFIFPAGGSGLYEVVNQQGVFREDKFAEAMSGLSSGGDAAKGGIMRGRRGGSKGQSEANVVKIIRTVKERDMIPCIIFSFSRKECEAYALSLKEMDFNSETEKALVKEIFKNAIDLLSDEDKKLPQIGQVLPLLQRGIGIHHSGLLPILKETVEILFGEGLLKTLFATETFSMGLNMPARTVLFTSARKFDGKDNRWITSGEYIQMAGRAGRRGKDDRGLVILMVDQQISSDDAKQIIKGATDPLNSQFRLTYNMVLNLMRVEDITPEFMLERSFHQFQNYAAIPGIKEKIRAKEAELDGMKVEGETELAGFFDMERQMEMLKASINKTKLSVKHIVPFLHPGRLFKIKTGSRDFGWGVLITFHRKVNPEDAHDMIYVLDMLIALDPSSAADVSNPGALKPPQAGGKTVWELVPMTIDCVEDLSAVRLKLPKDLSSKEARDQVARMVKEVCARFAVLPTLDPIKDMKIADAGFKSNVDKLADIVTRHASHPLRQNPDFERLAKQFREKEASARELKELRDELKRVKSLLHLNELSNRKRVLRRLGYAGDADAIQTKGRVACEVSAADELLLTEMIFGNVFEELDVPQVAALLSCFVFQENASPAKMAEELAGCLRQIQNYARRIAKISHECRLDIVEDEYVESFKPAMMDVVKNWVNGMSFAEILKTTDIFEGSIIRCFRRLEELLREMVGAAKAVQNTDLEAKFEMARTKIKRDIVFAASLYL